MSEKILAPEWVQQPERGSMKSVRLGAQIALRLGRPLARLFLYPICLYFLASSPAAVCNSRAYLARVLQRRPHLGDIFAHFLTFASCLLDRVFLLNEQLGQFDITVHNEAIVRGIEQAGGGCILLGAHFGSFEAARAIGRQRRGLPVSLLMYEENAKKIRAALAAINPRLATEVIGLGRSDSLLTVAERLAQGHFIGVLADRNVDGKDLVRLNFLGAPAAFPKGPFRVAVLLNRPVVLMAGLYRGANRYEVHFEQLAEPADIKSRDSEARIDAMMRNYVSRLEYYCRQAPNNWFNFYNFWA
jgi:predicted LPLAT superfamily acyltransferase